MSKLLLAILTLSAAASQAGVKNLEESYAVAAAKAEVQVKRGASMDAIEASCFALDTNGTVFCQVSLENEKETALVETYRPHGERAEVSTASFKKKK